MERKDKINPKLLRMYLLREKRQDIQAQTGVKVQSIQNCAFLSLDILVDYFGLEKNEVKYPKTNAFGRSRFNNAKQNAGYWLKLLDEYEQSEIEYTTIYKRSLSDILKNEKEFYAKLSTAQLLIDEIEERLCKLRDICKPDKKPNITKGTLLNRLPKTLLTPKMISSLKILFGHKHDCSCKNPLKNVTVGDLVQHSIYDLQRLRGIGPTSFKNLKIIFESLKNN